MNRKDYLISIAIVVACLAVFYLYSFTNTLVHGYIKIDSGDSTAKLKLRGNFFSSDIVVSGSEPEEINYRILRPKYLSISINQNGNSNNLTSYGPWGDLSKIKIKNNETTTLKIGSPLIIKPDVIKQPNLVSIGFSIVGQAGEQYQIPRTKANPRVKIMDENGNILASGNFAFG